MSQGPVREALRQLESEGLVLHRPNRGVFVAEITTADLLHLLLPVRLSIERHAIPLAAERMGGEGVAELGSLVAAMAEQAEAGDLAAVNELDVAFHERAVELSGSAQALQLWRAVQPRIRAQIHRLAPRHRRLEEIVAEHRLLLDAIAARDLAGLGPLLDQHVVGSARRLLGIDG